MVLEYQFNKKRFLACTYFSESFVLQPKHHSLRYLSLLVSFFQDFWVKSVELSFNPLLMVMQICSSSFPNLQLPAKHEVGSRWRETRKDSKSREKEAFFFFPSHHMLQRRSNECTYVQLNKFTEGKIHQGPLTNVFPLAHKFPHNRLLEGYTEGNMCIHS